MISFIHAFVFLTVSLVITFIPHIADYWNRSFYHHRLEKYTKKYTATTASINIYPVWLHSVRHVEHITWIITRFSQILFFVIPLYRTVLSLSSFTSLAPEQHIPDVDEQVWWIQVKHHMNIPTVHYISSTKDSNTMCTLCGIYCILHGCSADKLPL